MLKHYQICTQTPVVLSCRYTHTSICSYRKEFYRRGGGGIPCLAEGRDSVAGVVVVFMSLSAVVRRSSKRRTPRSLHIRSNHWNKDAAFGKRAAFVHEQATSLQTMMKQARRLACPTLEPGVVALCFVVSYHACKGNKKNLGRRRPV